MADDTGRPSSANIEPWSPNADEVARIVDEMRPVILRFAERSREQLASLATTRLADQRAKAAARVAASNQHLAKTA